MSPTTSELKVLQAALDKRYKLRNHPKNRKGITIVVSPETKKKRLMELSADRFRSQDRTENWLRKWKSKNKKG